MRSTIHAKLKKPGTQAAPRASSYPITGESTGISSLVVADGRRGRDWRKTDNGLLWRMTENWVALIAANTKHSILKMQPTIHFKKMDFKL